MNNNKTISISKLSRWVVTAVGCCLLVPIVPGFASGVSQVVGLPDPDINHVITTATSAYNAQVDSVKDSYNNAVLQKKLLNKTDTGKLEYNKSIFNNRFSVVKGHISDTAYNTIKNIANDKFARFVKKYEILITTESDSAANAAKKKSTTVAKTEKKADVLDASNIDSMSDNGVMPATPPVDNNDTNNGNQDAADAKKTNNIVSRDNKAIYLTDDDVKVAFDWNQTIPWATISVIAGVIILVIQGIMAIVRYERKPEEE